MSGLMDFLGMQGSTASQQLNDVKFSRANEPGDLINLAELEQLLTDYQSLGGQYTKAQLLRLKSVAERSSARDLKTGVAANLMNQILRNKLRTLKTQITHSKNVMAASTELQRMKGEHARNVLIHQQFSEIEYAGQKAYYNEMTNGADNLFAYLNQSAANLLPGTR